MSAVWRSLRDESFRSAWERTADRLADLRRERSFPAVSVERFTGRSPILNLAPFPLRRLWGGTVLQMLARLEVESQRRATAVAMPAPGGGWRIEWRDTERRQACLLRAPWIPEPEPLDNPGFEDTVLRAAELAGSSWVHFESAARVPLRSLLRLRARGVDWLLSVQDFALLSPWPQRIEEVDGKIEPPRDAAERLELAAEVLAQAAAVVFPSTYLRDAYAQLFPAKRRGRAIVASPALDLPPSSPPRLGPVRNVAFVGALQRHKGAHLLPEIAGLLDRAGPGRPSRFSVFGAGDPGIWRSLRLQRGLRLHGWYRAGSLADRLRREEIDLALLLSITPESYSLTLDECLNAGVPVLAFAVGALGIRIPGMRCGETVALSGGAPAVAACVAAMVAGQQPPDLQPDLWRVGQPIEAAQAHLDLYASIGPPSI